MKYENIDFAAMKLNDVLRQIRKKRNLSQQKVASALQIDRSTYSYYETGKSELDVKTLLALCAVYEVTLDEMLNMDDVVAKTLLVTNAKATFDAMQDERVPMSHYEQRLVQYLRLMDDRQRTSTLEYVMTLLEQPPQ